MALETRLSLFLKKISSLFIEKFFFFQNSFSSSIFFLFIGFLAGNLFGTFLNGIRTVIPWDGFIIVTLLIFIEIISYITYHKEGRSFFILWRFPFSYQKRLFWKCFNFFKIGLSMQQNC